MIDTLSYKILIELSKHDKTSTDLLYQKFGDAISDTLQALVREGYASACDLQYRHVKDYAFISAAQTYKITPKGLAIICERRQRKIEYWVPIIIADALSLLAVIISILK